MLPVRLALTLTPGLKRRPLRWATGAGSGERRAKGKESECWRFALCPSLFAMIGAHGRSCTCTEPLLRRLSLLLDYAGMKLAALDGLAPSLCASKAHALTLSYRAVKAERVGPRA